MKALVVFLMFAGAALAEDWKLQPLKHNDPDLVVDLGVGLWAWPLPMDYDDDGDYDLVVSCPDKPSNGFYFFENSTQDPSVKMPVFKPGVHVGRTGHNVQVSYVDGQPRVLRENFEFINFKKDGFSEKKKIYDTSNIHPGKTRAKMWRYVDWEGDGDQDLIVGIGDWSDYVWDHAYDAQGRWHNGPLHGWVYLIKNEDGKYSKTPVKIEAGGSPIDVYGWPSPNFADFDGDGDLDLICGEFLDGFTYFSNTGTRKNPVYAKGMKLKGDDGKPLVMHLQMITPTAIDWDRDGDMDLVVGDEDGRVALIENVGQPRFKQPVYFQQQADELKFGALATPFAHDWDQDGDEDILCGNTAGNIALFKNLDGNGVKWSAPELLEADGKTFRILAGDNGSIQGPAEAKWGYTTLSVADWNRDGRDDILVNSIWPKLQLLRNTKAGLKQGPLPFWTKEQAPAFYWWRDSAENLQTQWRTTPLATDFDVDGKLDLIILDQEGYLTCQSRAREETRIFLDEDLRPIRLNPRTAGSSGRVKLAVVDWDGDGRLDILTNSENATWWRNCKDAGDGRVVLKKIGKLARRNVAGHTSSPTVCDFDRNGKPDLIVGSENGRLYFIRHEDCVQFPADQLQAREPKLKKAPRFPGLILEETIYSGSCDAAALTDTTRGLVAGWTSGGRLLSSYHDGEKWSKPRELASKVAPDFLHIDSIPRLIFNRDGFPMVTHSFDRGRSFKPAQQLLIEVPEKRAELVLRDGRRMRLAEDDEKRLHLELESGDGWKLIGTISMGGFSHPTIIEGLDGKVHITFTSNRKRIRHAVVELPGS